MSFARVFVALLLMAVFLAACEGDGTNVEEDQIAGPAMIMFYTDG